MVQKHNIIRVVRGPEFGGKKKEREKEQSWRIYTPWFQSLLQSHYNQKGK